LNEVRTSEHGTHPLPARSRLPDTEDHTNHSLPRSRSDLMTIRKPNRITQLEDAVNSDEHDYDEEAASHPLIVDEHEGEGPSGEHLPDCEMFTGYDGSAGCSCGGFPCESGFSIGPARDPYGISCEHIQRDHPARGGRRIHRGVNPLPGPGPEPQYVEWAGGGYCAGDPLPVRDVVHLAADGRRE
jgi:hypothetical protein